MALLTQFATTCSMAELGGLSPYDKPVELRKVDKYDDYNAIIANTTSRVISKNLVKAGYKLVGTYVGNDAPTVYVHIAGLRRRKTVTKKKVRK